MLVNYGEALLLPMVEFMYETLAEQDPSLALPAKSATPSFRASPLDRCSDPINR